MKLHLKVSCDVKEDSLTEDEFVQVFLTEFNRLSAEDPFDAIEFFLQSPYSHSWRVVALAEIDQKIAPKQ